MPSPLGHALGGIAAAWIVEPPRERSNAAIVRSAALFATMSVLPDIDFLFNWHQGPTHSIGAAVIAGLVVAAVTRRPRLGAAAACAYASHILLDWLGADTMPPFGIMALWPFSHEHYLSRLDVFGGVQRIYKPGFWMYNIKSVLGEALILGPLFWLVYRMRLRSNSAP
jgi:membrane-bound metal-dependent hydrolase YbcI (DUF457 family)